MTEKTQKKLATIKKILINAKSSLAVIDCSDQSAIYLNDILLFDVSRDVAKAIKLIKELEEQNV